MLGEGHGIAIKGRRKVGNEERTKYEIQRVWSGAAEEEKVRSKQGEAKE
jgi:hypothetical protein